MTLSAVAGLVVMVALAGLLGRQAIRLTRALREWSTLRRQCRSDLVKWRQRLLGARRPDAAQPVSAEAEP